MNTSHNKWEDAVRMPEGDSERAMQQEYPVIVSMVSSDAGGQVGRFDADCGLGEATRLHLFQHALEVSGTAIVVLEPVRGVQLITYVNRAFELLTGYTSREATGSRWELLFEGLAQEAAVYLVARAINEAGPARAEWRCLRKDGRMFWSEVRAVTVLDANGTIAHCIITLRDMTATRQLLDQLHHQATHDALTGLVNRTILLERLNAAIAYADRQHESFAVAFIDVDSFKGVNDGFGHAVGDELLQHIATRLSRQIRADDLAARIGGDEFVVLINEFGEADSALPVLRRIIDSLRRPYVIRGECMWVTCSAGISRYPADGTDAATLLSHADAAMYRRKVREGMWPDL